MLEANVPKVLAAIGDADRVLDVGGWYVPFRRATHVLDVFPYETRGTGGYQGPEKESFSRDTWIQHDICSRVPWPFPDRSFDFVTCSHVLEDIRDPIWVCQEMMRVAKAGYIEVPSIEAELSIGMESRHWAGHQHHHWLVEMKGDRVVFEMKPHFIMGRWRFHLPASYGAALRDEQRVQWMFWKERFEVEETMIIHDSAIRAIERRVKATGAWPAWRYEVDDAIRRVGALRRGRG